MRSRVALVTTALEGTRSAASRATASTASTTPTMSADVPWSALSGRRAPWERLRFFAAFEVRFAGI